METLKKHITESPKIVNFTEVAPHVEHTITPDTKINIGGVSYDVLNQELVQKAEKYAQDNSCAFDVALIEVSKVA